MYERLKKLCELKGISITALCLKITGSRGNLSTWKKGNINSNYLKKISDYFGVSADYILGRTKNPNFCTSENQEDTLKQEFLTVFDKLSFTEKVEVMDFVLEKLKKNPPL
ncbi:MAG: helix-turn-helix transcriptional regulator [Ruminococcus sp.]|nr:helix-turn-helix transcriptional regulator [Ruminococcus sp.]